MSDFLSVDGLEAGYGDFQALFGVSLTVTEGETEAIIGANGAGKSTLLRAIAGQVTVTGGSIRFDGDDLVGVPPHIRVVKGIALVPEGRRVFPSLTVEENLLIGAYRSRPGAWTVSKVVELFPLLGRLLRRSAAKLSGGEQQALAIGRALMANPRLLLLDEVSLGLAPVIVKQLYEALPGILATGITLLLVEQDITRALSVADRVTCLLEGRVSLCGRPDELAQDDITVAYFGLPVSE
ncbi:MAG: ABC transporter ATP-binding protein [Acidimicrobiales bacterium]